MSWWDVIQELRSGKADNKKASFAMIGLGALAISSGVFVLIIPTKEAPNPVFQEHFKSILLTQFVIAVLCFLSGLGIQRKTRWGKILGQFCIIISLPLLIASPFILYPEGFFNEFSTLPFIIFALISFIVYIPIAYWGVRYLGRLEVKLINTIPEFTSYESISKSSVNTHKLQSDQAVQYHHSPLPFGMFGTFMVMSVSMFIVVGISSRFLEKGYTEFLLLPLFVIAFVLPIYYNTRPSVFEKEHVLIESWVGGGSMMWFYGQWPLFKLLVYKDGLEVRVYFHCYFIPYDKMDEPSEESAFFNVGVLIKSDLPEVPSRIRFGQVRAKNVLDFVKTQRSKYLAEKTKTAMINPQGVEHGKKD